MIIGKYVPPAAGLKPPSLWGTRARLEELFGSKGKVQTTSRHFSFPLPFAAALHRGVQHLVRPDEQDLRGAGRRPRAASGLRARSARADRARQSFRGWNDGGAERVPRGGDREEPLTALRLDQRGELGERRSPARLVVVGRETAEVSQAMGWVRWIPAVFILGALLALFLGRASRGTRQGAPAIQCGSIRLEARGAILPLCWRPGPCPAVRSGPAAASTRRPAG